MKKHARQAPSPQIRDEAIQIQSQLTAQYHGSHLEVLANIGDIDRQLRQIGKALKELRGES